MDTSNISNDSLNATLLAILTTQAKQGQMLEDLSQDSKEIKSELKEVHVKFNAYILKSEADIRFENLQNAQKIAHENMQNAQSSTQARLTELETWRMKFMVENVQTINDVQAESKKDLGDSQKVSLARIISSGGTGLLILIGFIFWMIEQFLVNSHFFGK